MRENKPSAAVENPGVPTDFSDYTHYDLREENSRDGQDVPVYQSMSAGMLFGEDATPLIYVEGRLYPIEAVARGMIEVSGSTEFLERIVKQCPVHKEQFARVLEAEGIN